MELVRQRQYRDWETANYAGPEADARTASARSVVDLNERRGQESRW